MRNRPASRKYGNYKITVDGFTFDSKGEAGRWDELKLLEKVGEISHLQRQVVYRLEVNNTLVCKYIADFSYCKSDGGLIVEDFKGFITPEAKVKLKLMRACLGIDVQIVKSKTSWDKKKNIGKPVKLPPNSEIWY